MINKSEVKTVERSTGDIINDGLLKYKTALKILLQYGLEELYGSEDDDQYPGKGEAFNRGVDRCIEIVKSL